MKFIESDAVLKKYSPLSVFLHTLNCAFLKMQIITYIYLTVTIVKVKLMNIMQETFEFVMVLILALCLSYHK